MTKLLVTSRTIAVEHIRISSGRPFAEVRRRLEGAVPRLDPGNAAESLLYCVISVVSVAGIMSPMGQRTKSPPRYRCAEEWADGSVEIL
jgi:hypothetical protein